MHSLEIILQVLNFDLFLGQQYTIQYSLQRLGCGNLSSKSAMR